MGELTTASTGNAARSGSIFGRVGKRKIEARWEEWLKTGGGGGGGGGGGERGGGGGGGGGGG